MAQSPLFKATTGSPLIGSPITHVVEAATVSSAVAFHRINLTVHTIFAPYVGGQSVNKDSRFSQPVNSGETIIFDVSSALIAAADSVEYTPNTLSFPMVAYHLEAWDEYMINGELHETGHTTLYTASSPRKALIGKFSDLERLLAGNSKSVQHFTRKPKTLPEIVMVGETMVCPQSFASPVSLGSVTTGQTSTVVSITTEGLQTINTRQVYALPAGQRDRYQFRFVNGLGCLESVSLSTLRTTEMNCTQETYLRSVQETFGSFSRAIVTKRNDFETWKMSTPPLDEAWQSWFMHEFLMTKHCWINIGGHWIPCHIIPEDTVTGINRQDNSLLTVIFSVRLDINGSPLAALAI